VASRICNEWWVVSLPTEHEPGDAPLARDRGRGPYVSRGGLKLANALSASGLPVAGRRALDVGASTGGFTDCLLRAGAERVAAIDVGYGQLDWSLRNDARVHVMERVNARAIEPEMVPFTADLAVVDVSFISLAKVLPAVLDCMTPTRDVLALVKPQFEIGRGGVGKGGVVRSAEDRERVLGAVGGAMLALGESVIGIYPAGLPGPKGNRETFLWLAEGERAGATREAAEVRRMAATAESAAGESAAAEGHPDEVGG
jgi:23S rRNA (cytidine1920-2'-O)/16S rRNA (cytidine1409-2'-O)-methyltransferase